MVSGDGQIPTYPTTSAQGAEDVQLRAEKLQRIVDDAVCDQASPEDFVEALREAGATPSEANNCGEQYSQRLAAELAEGHEDDEPDLREATPDGLNEDEQVEFRCRRDEILMAKAAEGASHRQEVADAVTWKILEAKLKRAVSSRAGDTQALSADGLLKILEARLGTVRPRSIPSSVLDAAPHLRNLAARVSRDPHLETTWKLRNQFIGKEVIDPLIDLLQSAPVDQALPCSIWKTIAQDQYVDFEKLFALTEPGYDHNDEAKDFVEGFALLKKDHSSKKSLKSEADWIRVFSAWHSAVLLLYPHREAELQGYERMVQEVFRAAPTDSSVGILFDVESRQRYANSPFRMDDRNHSFTSILSQLFCAKSTLGTKRPSDLQSSGSHTKKQAVICFNWNLGLCQDPCANKRCHGICSECGGQHACKEKESCYSSFQARRGKGSGSGSGEGSRASGSNSKS